MIAVTHPTHPAIRPGGSGRVKERASAGSADCRITHPNENSGQRGLAAQRRHHREQGRREVGQVVGVQGGAAVLEQGGGLLENLQGCGG